MHQDLDAQYVPLVHRKMVPPDLKEELPLVPYL